VMRKRPAPPTKSSACSTRKRRTRMTPLRGEVWLWDLGMAEKVGPALVVSAVLDIVIGL
jgi:hypothetical protein